MAATILATVTCDRCGHAQQAIRPPRPEDQYRGHLPAEWGWCPGVSQISTAEKLRARDAGRGRSITSNTVYGGSVAYGGGSASGGDDSHLRVDYYGASMDLCPACATALREFLKPVIAEAKPQQIDLHKHSEATTDANTF